MIIRVKKGKNVVKEIDTEDSTKGRNNKKGNNKDYNNNLNVRVVRPTTIADTARIIENIPMSNPNNVKKPHSDNWVDKKIRVDLNQVKKEDYDVSSNFLRPTVRTKGSGISKSNVYDNTSEQYKANFTEEEIKILDENEEKSTEEYNKEDKTTEVEEIKIEEKVEEEPAKDKPSEDIYSKFGLSESDFEEEKEEDLAEKYSHYIKEQGQQRNFEKIKKNNNKYDNF